MQKFTFSIFEAKDYPAYKSWFDDAELNLRLGPMDEKWLDSILEQKDGCEYAVFRDNELIGVIGIKLPIEGYPDYYITDFAVMPALRRTGTGSEILRQLITMHPLEEMQKWKAFIDTENPAALLFFKQNGWYCLSEIPDEHGMILMQYS